MDVNKLWRSYKTDQDHAAWTQLVEFYASLVKHVAGRLRLVLPTHVDYDDLVGSGTFGLLAAIDRFEPDRGVKFETFASTRIRGAILDSLRAADWAPRSLRQREREIAHAYGLLETSLGRPARAIEVADHLGISVDELYELERQINQVSFLSLDAPLTAASADDNQGSLGALIACSSNDPLQSLEHEEKRQVLVQAVEALPQRERLVISLYYFDDLNIKEIAQVLEVTDSRISQLHTRALLRLRGRLLHYSEELGIDSDAEGQKERYAAAKGGAC